jgi:putative SOS response-associated peptidase YedK
MCGRYTMTAETRQMERRFGARFVSGRFEPTYNAAPSQLLPIIVNEEPDAIVLARWGFLPEWAPSNTKLTPQINARLEGIERKRMFMDAYRGRHCLVIADGFYEWTQSGKHQPFRFTMRDGVLFAFAGIWARGDDDAPARFAIITTQANELVQQVHRRMPVIVPRGSEKAWLPATPSGMTIFPPTPAEAMRSYPVTMRVNSPAFNEPQAIAPLEAVIS